MMDWKDRFWLYVLFAMLIGMFALVSLTWGHSVNDKIGGYSWQDYACEHKIHDGYDIHHEHGNGIEWHWHKHARKDGGGLLESYVAKHTGDLVLFILLMLGLQAVVQLKKMTIVKI